MKRAGDVLQQLQQAQALLDQKRAESKKLAPIRKSPSKVKRTPTIYGTVIEEPAKPTPRQLLAVQTADDISSRQPLPGELTFLARNLVQVTLPHSDPGDVPRWTRTNGNVTLVMASTGIDNQGNPIGYPYGSIPRLLLYWMTTEAKRTGNRKLILGNTLAQFMREVGLTNTGRGKRSNAYRIRDQIRRLFSTTIGFHQSHNIDGLTRDQFINMTVADAAELWWDSRHIDQGNLWASYVVLSERFFEALTHSVVPADTRALAVLKKSPLALDLYAWATYRAYALRAKGEPEFISYQQMTQQFGCNYSRPDNFKHYFLAALKQVCTVYPKLQVSTQKAGITISNHSRTAVPIAGFKTTL